MPESAGWQFAVEVNPTGWVFPAGPSWVAGWIFAGNNRYVTDLRAWVDGRAFLGLPGLPKPGWDEKFLGRPGPPYSGFVFLVTPHRGATLLRLEARDPITFAGAAAVLVAVGALAAWIPARRAARLDPVRVLREG